MQTMAVTLKCNICHLDGCFVCGGCRMVQYCGKRCQKIDWKHHHKHICSRIWSDKLPADATCYICFDGVKEGALLRRGCACRNYVHLGCALEYASVNHQECAAICGVCKQSYHGPLLHAMFRSSPGIGVWHELHIMDMPFNTDDDLRARVTEWQTLLASMADFVSVQGIEVLMFRDRCKAILMQITNDAESCYCDLKDKYDKGMDSLFRLEYLNMMMLVALYLPASFQQEAMQLFVKQGLDTESTRWVSIMINAIRLEHKCTSTWPRDKIDQLTSYCRRKYGPQHVLTQTCIQMTTKGYSFNRHWL